MGKSNQNYRKSLLNCWKKFIIFIIAIRTFIVRCIFILYAATAIWNVVIVKTSVYWLLLTTLIPLFIETFIGIHQIKLDVKPSSKVSKWFSPVVFLFLISACPPIWIMELTIATNISTKIDNSSLTTARISIFPCATSKPTNVLTDVSHTTLSSASIIKNFSTNSTMNRQRAMFQNNKTDINMTDIYSNITINSTNGMSENITENLKLPKSVNVKEFVSNITSNNSSSVQENITTSIPTYPISQTGNSSVFFNTMTDAVNQITKSSSKTTNKRAIEDKETGVIGAFEHIMGSIDVPYRITILEQILLLTLIICRWLLPRGGISRDQLSQLLLVNIGMAADILELFEAIKEDVVRHHLLLNLIILTLWQASLFQFSLTKTVTKARKVRVGFFEDYSSKSNTESKLTITNCICCQTELWAIATSLCLQDVPFFCLRMTLIMKFNVLSYSNIFFTCKNSLVILLQLFRSYVILSGSSDDNQINSTVSRQSLAAPSLTRWNKIPSNPTIMEPIFDSRKALFMDQYELPVSRSGKFSDILPKASPETSISSKENIPNADSMYSLSSLKCNNKNEH